MTSRRDADRQEPRQAAPPDPVVAHAALGVAFALIFLIGLALFEIRWVRREEFPREPERDASQVSSSSQQTAPDGAHFRIQRIVPSYSVPAGTTIEVVADRFLPAAATVVLDSTPLGSFEPIDNDTTLAIPLPRTISPGTHALTIYQERDWYAAVTLEITAAAHH